MKAVTIHDAKTNLSKYIAAAKRGEKIYIGSFGKPEVVLGLPPKAKVRRKPGIMAGQIWIDDDFDDPMPELIFAINKDIHANTA